MWQHNYEPIAGSLGVSAVVAAIPIVVLFLMLGVFRKPAWMSALSALVSAMLVALVAYGMPVQLAVISAIYGAAFGVFPIAWIVFASIMLYRLAVDTGKFEIIKDSIGGLTDRPSPPGDVHRVLVRRLHRGRGRLRRPGRRVGCDARGTRLQSVLCRRHLSAGQHRAGRLRIDRYSGDDAGERDGAARAAAQRDGRHAVRDGVDHHPWLPDRRHGRCEARRGSAARHRRVRSVVCRCAVLRVENTWDPS